MQTPRVSICLPNLNTRPYLEERVETILSQSLQDWELIVVDSYSDDGSWEFFTELAARDPRVHIAQAPRGLYASWNRCIQLSRGEYVYIATSDDTMASDCLEKLVLALDRHRRVDLAHCTLRTIDPQGGPVEDPRWPDCTVLAFGTEDVLRLPHLRRAPFDGLLHLTGQTVYCSATQLLIRRSLFQRIGYFNTHWGSIADFNWNMKASLASDTVHVPDTWASFRIHPTQATASVNFHSPEFASRVEEMIDDAFNTCEQFLKPELADAIKSRWLPLAKQLRLYYAGLRIRRDVRARRAFQARELIAGPMAVRTEITRRMFGARRWPDAVPRQIHDWLVSSGLQPIVVLD